MQKVISFIVAISFVLPVSAFAAGNAPSIETKPVVNITYNSADLSATITPGDSPDNVYWFEWGISGNLSDTVFKTPVRTLSASYARSANYTLRGLAPSTQYFYRVVAENQSDHIASQTIYFTTKSYDTPTQAIVIAETLGTTVLRDTSVTLHGYVAPHNESARYWFEWGTDSKLGQVTYNSWAYREGGEVTTQLNGLVPGTTYYYRIVAENDRGDVTGATKSFKTTGVKPVEETKRDQTNTKASAQSSTGGSSTSDSSGLFGLFGSSGTKVSSKKNVPSVSGSDLSGSVGSSMSGIGITVKPIGSAGVHQTIEYKIAYDYERLESASKAQLEIALPSTLVYMGDTTASELRVREGNAGARVYILPIGTIKKGDTRTFSVLAMTTGDSKGIPQVDAKLVFTAKSGKQMIAGVGAVAGSVTRSNDSSGSSGAFPTSLILWLVILNVIVGSVIGMIRAKEWYKETKARIADAEEKAKAKAAEIKTNIVGAEPAPVMVVVPHQPVPMKPRNRSLSAFEHELDEVKGEEIDEFGLPGAYTVAA